MKKIFNILCLAFAFNAFGATIILDPGHGGEDKGAVYKGQNNIQIFEKELTLAYAKVLARELKKRKHRVYLTRSIDRSVSLLQRAALADKIKADLFISLHMNAAIKKTGHGFETYFLENKKDKALKKIEKIENGPFANEDPIVQHILTELIFDRTTKSSKLLGKYIHRNISSEIRTKYHMHDRGLRSGLFYVLALSKRPAVLLEVGFMTNPRELEKIVTGNFQHSYVRAVANGVDQYLQKDRVSSL